MYKKRKRAKTWKYWTKKDEQAVIDLYSNHTQKEIGEKLGRTEQAVCLRAKVLIQQGKLPKNKERLDLWTSEEDQIVRDLYGSGFPAKLVGARCNNRNDHSVRHRAMTLQVKSPNYNISVFKQRCLQQVRRLDEAIQNAQNLRKEKGNCIRHGYPDLRNHKTGIMREIKNGRDYLSPEQILTHDFIYKFSKKSFRNVRIIWYPYASKKSPQTGKKLEFKNYHAFRSFVIQQLKGKRDPKTGDIMVFEKTPYVS